MYAVINRSIEYVSIKNETNICILTLKSQYLKMSL
jgi:hypothetical protein